MSLKGIRIKVCGMMHRDNISQLVDLDPDFIGFIFYKRSARYVGKIISSELISLIPNSIAKVAVFVDEDIEIVKRIYFEYNFSYVQLHGNENVDYCRQLKDNKIPIIKAFRISAAFNFESIEMYNSVCDYYLFDTDTMSFGGSGQKFDWNILSTISHQKPFFLSGGIGLHDAKALASCKMPLLYAIDLNSKFEIEAGRKNIKLLKQFLTSLNIN